MATLSVSLHTSLPAPGSGSAGAAASGARGGTAPRELSVAEQRQVRELQQIDRNVRAHEQAHISAGRGVVTGGPNYTFTYGPDGRAYATAGEVGIDTSPERKPEENIDKGQRIQAAALAPRDPSPQDYRVAAAGGQLEAQGRQDLQRQRLDEQAIDPAADERTRARLDRAYGAGASPGVAGFTISRVA